jgi:hypothetical protein
VVEALCDPRIVEAEVTCQGRRRSAEIVRREALEAQ